MSVQPENTGEALCLGDRQGMGKETGGKVRVEGKS